MTTAISFDNVSKQYALASAPVGLREALTSLWHPRRTPSRETLWALRDISFGVRRGEVLGLIGHNGAGKSTMLKLIAGITEPTVGRIGVAGRVGSLIELGAGFHPDLTGRENVYLNGQIMGMTRSEITARYDAIVELAELHDFMHEPVKHYSSGMYARLGFAVAAHMEPDVLLVDEVLSVGDAAFQRKSQDRMAELVRGGRAVVFVSHNLLAVERLCHTVIWLQGGQIRQIGDASEVLRSYLASEEERLVSGGRTRSRREGLAIEEVIVDCANGTPGCVLESGSDLRVRLRYSAHESLGRAQFVIGVAGPRGVLFTANMLLDGKQIRVEPGTGVLECVFKAVPLMPGAYQLYGEAWGEDGYTIHSQWSEWARFRISHAPRELLPLAESHSVYHLQSDAPILVPYEWRGQR